MEELCPPCNSLKELDSNLTTTIYTPDCTQNMGSLRAQRKSRSSISDLEIIHNNMSIKRKKTLMCTEQNNFNNLEKLKTPTYPKKKYSAVAPSEYSKFSLKQNKITISANNNNRYGYPEDVLSCNKIKEIKAMQPEEYGK